MTTEPWIAVDPRIKIVITHPLVKAVFKRWLWMCSNCGVKDHCHGEVAWCMCECTEDSE